MFPLLNYLPIEPIETTLKKAEKVWDVEFMYYFSNLQAFQVGL
jgi:hypothetical protein